MDNTLDKYGETAIRTSYSRIDNREVIPVLALRFAVPRLTWFDFRDGVHNEKILCSSWSSKFRGLGLRIYTQLYMKIRKDRSKSLSLMELCALSILYNDIKYDDIYKVPTDLIEYIHELRYP
jgi:hypothetical protein